MQFFARLRRRWHHGMNGPTGLVMTDVLAMLRLERRRNGLTQEQADDILDCVEAMEQAALNAMHSA